MKPIVCFLASVLLISLIPQLGLAQEGGELELGKGDLVLQDNMDAAAFRSSIRIVLGDTLSGVEESLLDELFAAVDGDSDGFISEQELDESSTTVRDGAYGLVIAGGTVSIMAYRRHHDIGLERGSLPETDETADTEDELHR